MPDDIVDTIVENATKPASASGDGVSAAQHSISEQIAADKYAKSQAAASNTTGNSAGNGAYGFVFAKFRPPGGA